MNGDMFYFSPILRRENTDHVAYYVVYTSVYEKRIWRMWGQYRRSTMSTKNEVTDPRWEKIPICVYEVAEKLGIGAKNVIRTGEFSYWATNDVDMISIRADPKEPLASGELISQLASETASIIADRIDRECYTIDALQKSQGIKYFLLARVYAIKMSGQKLIKNNLPNRYYVMCKLDGVRCALRLVNGKTQAISRNFMEFSVASLLAHEEFMQIYRLIPGVELDCEIYCHGLSLQRISGAVRSKTMTDDLNLLTFQVFTHRGEGTAIERWTRLKEVFDKLNLQRIQLLTKYDVTRDDELDMCLEQAVASGHEGLMIWGMDGLYEQTSQGARSKNLLKYKPYIDLEVTIVDLIPETTQSVDVPAVFVCEMINEQMELIRTNVRPASTLQERVYAMTNPSLYVGRMITIKFMNWTPDGHPQHPTMVDFFDGYS